MSDLFDEIESFRAKLGASREAKPQPRISTARRGRPGSRGRNVRPATSRSQRVVMKASISKLGGKGAEKAKAHLKYLLRDEVKQGVEPAVLFNKYTAFADENGEYKQEDLEKAKVSPEDFIAKCEGDSHIFRFILSPENGDRLDLESYTKEVMARIEKDVKGELDWVAVVHKNTDNPHVHIALRGKIDGKKDLYFTPEYISNGIRRRAQEVATQELGQRTREDVTRVYEKEVKQHRLTSLDRNIIKSTNKNLKVKPRQLFGRDEEKNALIRKRLEYLADLKLVTKEGKRWTLSPNFSESLKDLGRRDDIIHRMHNAGKKQSGDWRFEVPKEETLARVAHRGLTDDHSGSHFIIADGADGRTYYLDKDQALASEAKPGSIIKVGGKTKASVLSTDRLNDIVKYQGPTVLDHPSTYELLEKNDAQRGQFMHELRAQVAERQKYLRKELDITFENGKPSYVELRSKELQKACEEIAKNNNAEAIAVKSGVTYEGKIIEEVKLNSGTYCSFKSVDGQHVMLIQVDKHMRDAMKSGKPISISLHDIKGRKRLLVSPLETTKETNMKQRTNAENQSLFDKIRRKEPYAPDLKDLKNLIKHKGSTMLDSERMYEFLEKSKNINGKDLEEIREAVAKREEFLKEKLKVSFEGGRPNYGELYNLDRAAQEKKDRKLSEYEMMARDQFMGENIEQFKLRSGNYIGFNSIEKDELQVIQPEKSVLRTQPDEPVQSKPFLENLKDTLHSMTKEGVQKEEREKAEYRKSLEELVKHKGRTVLDDQQTYLLLNSMKEDNDIHKELRAQVTARQKFLKEELGITFKDGSPSVADYKKLRRIEINSTCTDIAKKYGAEPINLRAGVTYEGKILEKVKVDNNYFCSFKSADGQHVALIPADKSAVAALKNGKLVSITVQEKDGQNRLLISSRDQNKSKGMSR